MGRDNVGLATLSNGLRIVTDRIPTVETVSLGLWVDVGTRHEPAAVNGVAHFLEHMAFKGTERRSASPRRSKRSAGISTPIPHAKAPRITPRC
jgi:predicted Zn-dependent peptidase